MGRIVISSNGYITPKYFTDQWDMIKLTPYQPTGVSNMRYWIQFMDHAVSGPWNNHTSPLIDACGDSGVFVLDGRNSQETMHVDALRRAQRMEHWKKYKAYKICSGSRLFQPTRESAPRILNYPIRTL